MSLFRGKARGKSRGKSLREPRVSTIDLASSLFPAAHAVPVVATHAPRRRRRRSPGYVAGRSRLPMFRVT